MPVVNGHAQPLCARFSVTSLDTRQHLVAQGRSSLTALQEATTITWVEHETWSTVADECCFADIDTPCSTRGLRPEQSRKGKEMAYEKIIMRTEHFRKKFLTPKTK